MSTKLAPEITLLAELSRTLTRDGIPAAYVQEELRWVKSRNDHYTRALWRIGIAGVTSSGKSTLINAMLGEDLLPRESRPTSGVLVACSKGPERVAQIIFVDGTRKTLKGGQLTEDAIAEYADEDRNPKNRYGVTEICLKSPGFVLPDGVEIIDSPGLDAFGLENHEALTLRQLVPSVDLVMYLTTTKANSDRKNLAALDEIASEDKPVIVVQNFLDAVEPELGSGGVERRSRAEVAERLRQRVQNLLNLAKTPSLRMAQIIQVSAYQGLMARHEGGGRDERHWSVSHMGALLQLLADTCTGLEQRRSERRLEQVRRQIGELIDRCRADEALYSGLTEATERLLQDISSRRNMVEQLFRQERDAFDYLNRLVNQMHTDTRAVIETARDPQGETEQHRQWLEKRGLPTGWSTRSQEEYLKEASGILKTLALGIQRSLLAKLDEVEATENNAFAALNLTVEDKRRQRSPADVHGVPQVAFKEESYTHTWTEEKSNGILGISWLWRTMTNQSHYETYSEIRKRTVVDVRATITALQTYVDSVNRQMQKLVETWTVHREECLRTLRSEVVRLERALAQRKDKPANRQVLQRLISDLMSLRGGGSSKKEVAASKMPRPQVEQPALKPQTKPIQFTEDSWKVAEGLLHLSCRQRRLYHEAFLHALLESHRLILKGMALGIWGRDRRDLDLYCMNALGINPAFDADSGPKKVIPAPPRRSLHGLERLVLVDGMHSQVSSIDWARPTEAFGFVLFALDLLQVGATRKHLTDPVVAALRRYPHAILVQSVTEHVAGESLSEAYLTYRRLCHEFQLPPGALVNDRSPFYTALFYVADRHSFRGGLGEEHHALAELQQLLPGLMTAERQHEAGAFFKRVAKDLGT